MYWLIKIAGCEILFNVIIYSFFVIMYVEEIKHPMLYKVIYREIAMTWKYAENLTQERSMSYLEDGRHPINGEIVDEAESIS
jgi:hypothetical protein